MTERLTDEVSRLSGILKVCGESVCKNRCSECDFLDTAIEKLRDYENIGTVEELKAIKQWKSDIIESFSKYDVNSVDELMKRFKELTENNNRIIEYKGKSVGKWIFKNDGAYGKRRAYCSACGKRSGIGGIESNQKKPFCPNCGAEMQE